MTSASLLIMWQFNREILRAGQSLRYVVRSGAAEMSYGKVLMAGSNDFAFRDFFIGLLADAEFPAYRWETPPLTKATIGRAFEFVLFTHRGWTRSLTPIRSQSNSELPEAAGGSWFSTVLVKMHCTWLHVQSRRRVFTAIWLRSSEVRQRIRSMSFGKPLGRRCYPG